MLFSSITFIFYFLPLTMVAYFFFRKNIVISNYILLVFSLLFYSWGEPIYMAIMLLSVILNYGFGLLINRHHNANLPLQNPVKNHNILNHVNSISNQQNIIKNNILKSLINPLNLLRLSCNKYQENPAKIYLILGIFANLIILFYFKYLGFFIVNFVKIFHLNFQAPKITMPIGISFYTFQAMSYIIDLYRKEIKVQKNISNLALYISFFPQLIAGPIVRYKTVEDEILHRKINQDDVLYGIRRFIIGLGKKVIIANQFALYADSIFSSPINDISQKALILGIFSYSLQIYFDFSGYSSMAIGLGRIFGFRFNENFNYPYTAKSVQEFWQRWHISLSSFLRDYLYIPLGGNRGSKLQTYRNLIITFLLCGLWHGAEWTFIIWGLYFGFFLILERIYLKKILDKMPIFGLFYCLIIVAIGWLIFRANDLNHLLELAKLLIFGNNAKLTHQFSVLQIILVFFGLIGSTNFFKRYIFYSKNKLVLLMMDFYLILVFIVVVSFLASSTYNPFIYFRF